MRNTIVVSAVAVFLISGLAGCKSAPKMPWSKTAATSDVESAALAHSAPSLPADIAKQAESLAASVPSIDLTTPQASGGQAPAYSPATANLAAAPASALGSGAKTTPTAYPTTGASPYSTTAAPTIAATTPNVPPAFQSTDTSANLGTVDLPYNPNAVPPAKNVASTTAPVTPNVRADRYGASALASTAPAYGKASPPPTASASTTAAVPQLSSSDRYGADRYGNHQNIAATPAKTSPAIATPATAGGNLASTGTVASSTTNQASPYVVPAATSGDRYATKSTGTPSASSESHVTPTTATPTSSAPVVVASASVYRPGGTTSYEGLATNQAAFEIASRTQPADQQVPNVATPSTTPEPSQAPRYR